MAESVLAGGVQFAEQNAGEGGFARPVLAHEGHLVLPGDHQVHVAEDLEVIKPLGQAFGFHDHLARPRGRREAKPHLGVFELVDLDPLHFVELLDEALGEGGLVLFRAELVDELLGVGDFLLLLLGRLFLSGSLLLAPGHVLAVRGFVVVHAEGGDLHGPVGHMVEEGAIVRNQDHGPWVVLEEAFKPLDGFNVEVVGGLVQQQEVRGNEQKLAQFDPHLPASAEFAHFPMHVIGPEAESLQHALGLFLLDAGPHEGQTVVDFAQPIDEAGIGLTLVVGALCDFGRNAFHLILHFLESGEGALGFLENGGVLIVLHLLREVTNAVILWSGYVALARILDPGNDLEQGGLARTVASHKAHAVLAAHSEGDVLKQGAVSEMDADLVQVEHGVGGGNEKRPQRWAFLGVRSAGPISSARGRAQW